MRCQRISMFVAKDLLVEDQRAFVAASAQGFVACLLPAMPFVPSRRRGATSRFPATTTLCRLALSPSHTHASFCCTALPSPTILYPM